MKDYRNSKTKFFKFLIIKCLIIKNSQIRHAGFMDYNGFNENSTSV